MLPTQSWQFRQPDQMAERKKQDTRTALLVF